MPIINFISLMHLQHAQIRLLISFYLLADFSQVFLQIFSKKFSPEKQALNTKSLLRAENQTRNCKTIFQKSTKSKEKTKSQNPKNALNADNLKFFSRLLPRDYIGSSLFHFWLLVDVFFVFWQTFGNWFYFEVFNKSTGTMEKKTRKYLAFSSYCFFSLSFEGFLLLSFFSKCRICKPALKASAKML